MYCVGLRIHEGSHRGLKENYYGNQFTSKTCIGLLIKVCITLSPL
jgi:hypothetical protein